MLLDYIKEIILIVTEELFSIFIVIPCFTVPIMELQDESLELFCSWLH